jgi:hypothetical protein
VIDVVQSGFVGAWGEGAYSQNFTTNGVITDADWTERKAVVTRVLSAVPAGRMVQVRTPTMKQKMYGTTPLAPAAAYTGSGAARGGHHNDCFLASSDDKNTYVDPDLEYPYLQAETTYVAMGGETCALNRPRSDSSTRRMEGNRSWRQRGGQIFGHRTSVTSTHCRSAGICDTAPAKPLSTGSPPTTAPSMITCTAGSRP